MGFVLTIFILHCMLRGSVNFHGVCELVKSSMYAMSRVCGRNSSVIADPTAANKILKSTYKIISIIPELYVLCTNANEIRAL